MARTYKRDGNGRFAGGGGGSSGGGSKRPAAKTVSRGVNRLTRDNAGTITSVGGTGATARGGRLKTASGNQRATQTAKGIKRSSPPGAIRKTDVVYARTFNGISKNIEARNKNGLNNPVRETHNSTTRQAAAAKRVATQKRAAKPAAAAARTAAPKPAAASKTPSNKIAASPRQLSRNEQTARDVMTNKSFRSDRQRIAEMQRRGIDRNTDFVGLVANVRAKQGGGTTAKIKPASKPAAASKSTARPLSQRETQNLGLAKSNLAISKERLAFAREAKAKAKGPLEKLKATDRINEHQTNIRGLNKKITAINARPAPGRPITGADRSGNRKQLSAPRKSGAIKGSIKRDASASSKLKNKSGLNAGKFKNIYMANANKAAAAKRKRKP